MEQSDLLRFTAETLDRLEILYALVGSFASGIWGETRFTQDIDIVVELGPQHVDALCRAFPAEEFYLSRVAVAEAVAGKRPFNVIHPTSGNKIDFMVQGAAAWQQGQLARRQLAQLAPEFSLYVASPADVIIGKLAYYAEGGSEKHLRDITGILRISGELVDHELVDREADALGVAETWRRLSAQSL